MSSSDAFDGSPFTAAMATDAGMTRSRLRSLVRTGEVRKVLHGVYVRSSIGDSIALRARAAALVVPDHAVVCDRCAAWLHGIDILEFAELDLLPDLDVVSTGGKNGSIRAGLFGGKRDLLPSELMVVEGVSVTTPLRTACDIACLRGRFRALATLDEFRRSYRLSHADLYNMVPRFAGRRGVIQLRELIPLSTHLADSQPESWVRLMIHDEGLPMPQPQVWVTVPGWGRVRIENAYEHLRVAVEYDGEEFHTDVGDREHDDDRRAALDVMGWIILIIRKGDLSEVKRAVWLHELGVAIAGRAPAGTTKRIYARGPDHPSYRWRRR
ncbi:MAG: hypothetical protein NTX33_12985 [Propionibacteriales bacterium]|nr:hypothetical protein [Propionibacteriales bacterium]